MADHEYLREHLLRIQCAHCGDEVIYKGTGRRPTYCSASCRSRAWELRRAAARLAQPDPMPAVVREVIERERVVVRDRPVRDRTPRTPRGRADWAGRAAGTGASPERVPDTVSGWLPLLTALTHQVRQQPLVLVRGFDDQWQDLANAVRELHRSFAWRDQGPRDQPARTEPWGTPPGSWPGGAPASGPGQAPEQQPLLSRQQRRALERQQRKQHPPER